jgi:hypothetical protein
LRNVAASGGSGGAGAVRVQAGATAEIFESRINGDVIVVGTVRIAHTLLQGTAGGATCVGAFDESFAPLNASCVP